MSLSSREQVIMRFMKDRYLAHQVIFKHRHRDKTPAFQRTLIEDWHSEALFTIHQVFRGGGKSTLAEEAVCLKAAFREFKNCVLVGETAERAADRLRAIKSEIATNDVFNDVFGDLRGSMWDADRIILSTGAMIQTLGRGQAVRGIKHEDQRPDLILCDDIENRGDMDTPEKRQKVQDWFFKDLIPACDPEYKCNVAATPLHPESLAQKLYDDYRWIGRRFPIYYLNDDGERESSWPERFSMKYINDLEDMYRRIGQVQGFRAEYLCEPEAPEAKAFKREYLKIEPRVRRWEAIYTFTDPARTVGAKSADTGHAVWSWIGPKLIVWDAWAKQLMPNEIVKEVFDSMETYKPVWTGIEEDGLNQWLMQPIREESVRRGMSLPVKPVKAPNGKLSFIRGLQPFFMSGEASFAKPLQELADQLLAFPNGKIDAPNALAYALKMRPGAPIYEDFRDSIHVAEEIRPVSNQMTWLALNATPVCVTGMLIQTHDNSMRVFADWVMEGDPQMILTKIIGQAQLVAGRKVSLVMGPKHFDQYHNVGLRQAATRIPVEVQQGTPPAMGRTRIIDMLQREERGRPRLMISADAVWTLNGLSGGYGRALGKDFTLADYAEEGPYKVLMEGFESLCGLLEINSPNEAASGIVYGRLPNGQQYVTARR